MTKLIYHMGTGTYFGLDDDVVIIDTDEVPQDRLDDLYDTDDPTVAEQYGRELTGIDPDDENGRGCRSCDKPISHGDYCSQYCKDVDRMNT